MAAQPRIGFPGLRDSRTCAEAIVSSASGAGVVVERRTGVNLIGVAADASVKVCGVAIDDVPAVATFVGQRVVGAGNEMTVYSGGYVNVVANLAVTEGQLICAAAGGQVRPALAGDITAGAVIGRANAAAAGGAVVEIFIKPGG